MGSTDKPKDICVSHKARCSSMGMFCCLVFCVFKKKNRSQWESWRIENGLVNRLQISIVH